VRRLKLGACAVSLLLISLLAATAEAATMTARYKGYVSAGYDYTGVFGEVGRDLSGLSFEGYFRYDTRLGVTDAHPFLKYVYGGSGYGTASPMLESYIIINGVRQNFSGAMNGTINFNPGYFVDHLVQDSSGGNELQLWTVTEDAPSLSEPYHSSFITDYGGYFYIRDYNGGDHIWKTRVDKLTTTSVTIAPIPEPTTWALLILGFGAVGFQIRRLRAGGLQQVN